MFLSYLLLQNILVSREPFKMFRLNSVVSPSPSFKPLIGHLSVISGRLFSFFLTHFYHYPNFPIIPLCLSSHFFLSLYLFPPFSFKSLWSTTHFSSVQHADRHPMCLQGCFVYLLVTVTRRKGFHHCACRKDD